MQGLSRDVRVTLTSMDTSDTRVGGVEWLSRDCPGMSDILTEVEQECQSIFGFHGGRLTRHGTTGHHSHSNLGHGQGHLWKRARVNPRQSHSGP